MRHGVVRPRDARVCRLRDAAGDAGAPGVRRLLWENPRALHLVEAEDDLLDGEVVAHAAPVARLGDRHLPAALVHHRLEERLVSRRHAPARREQNAQVGCEPWETMFLYALRLYVLKVALHVFGRVGVNGLFHKIEV